MDGLLVVLVLMLVGLMVFAAFRDDKPLLEHVENHWCQTLEGFTSTPQFFYDFVKQKITEHQIPGVRFSIHAFHEGGIHTDKLDYLRVTRGNLVYDICAAKVGKNFFVSSWFAVRPGTALDMLGRIPVLRHFFIGFQKLFQPETYYQIDSAQIFNSAVHHSILAVIDEISSLQGVPKLPEDKRAPILRELAGIKPRRAVGI